MGRRAWLPLAEGAAAFSSQDVAVVGELRLEGKLFPVIDTDGRNSPTHMEGGPNEHTR
jgi:hypothetical protein